MMGDGPRHSDGEPAIGIAADLVLLAAGRSVERGGSAPAPTDR